MDIPFAMVADEANVSTEGKLNVLGVFNRISSKGFPTMHPSMVFVFAIRAEHEDSGREFAFRVRLVDPDGGVLRDTRGVGKVPKVRPGDSPVLNQILRLKALQFAATGTHRFTVELAWKPDVPPFLEHETPIHLVKIEE